jgi:hypothetical protein
VSASERNIHLGLLGAALSLTIWVFGAERHSAEPATRAPAQATDQRAPLSIIPPGSAFVLSADLRTLTRSPLGAFIAERLGQRLGASKLAKSCGEDLLTRIDRLALAVPSANLGAEEHPEDFGIVAAGRFSAADITRCASSAISARGGETVQTKLGSFDSVRDRKAGSGEIAAKDGLLVVSGGSYFRELLDSAESNRSAGEQGDSPDTAHAELRRTLGPGPLLVSWLLGEHWFERVAFEETNARLSPLRALKTVGARLDVGEKAELVVLLECADSQGALSIASLLDELRSSLDALPLDPALSRIAKRVTVNRAGTRLRLELELSQAELSPMLDALHSR